MSTSPSGSPVQKNLDVRPEPSSLLLPDGTLVVDTLPRRLPPAARHSRVQQGTAEYMQDTVVVQGGGGVPGVWYQGPVLPCPTTTLPWHHPARYTAGHRTTLPAARAGVQEGHLWAQAGNRVWVASSAWTTLPRVVILPRGLLRAREEREGEESGDVWIADGQPRLKSPSGSIPAEKARFLFRHCSSRARGEESPLLSLSDTLRTQPEQAGLESHFARLLDHPRDQESILGTRNVRKDQARTPALRSTR